MANRRVVNAIASVACVSGGLGLYAVAAGVMVGALPIIYAGLALLALFALTAIPALVLLKPTP